MCSQAGARCSPLQQVPSPACDRRGMSGQAQYVRKDTHGAGREDDAAEGEKIATVVASCVLKCLLRARVITGLSTEPEYHHENDEDDDPCEALIVVQEVVPDTTDDEGTHANDDHTDNEWDIVVDRVDCLTAKDDRNDREPELLADDISKRGEGKRSDGHTCVRMFKMENSAAPT